MLAIIIPYYKIKFFKETLDSLAKQTNKNFRVYIGNDASPDDPEGLIGNYSSKLDISYRKFDENLGGSCLPEHWQRCIDMIDGEEWIMVLGDDDFIDKNVVDVWYKKFNAFKATSNIIRFSTILVDQDSKSISKKYIHPELENVAESFIKKQNRISRSSLSEYIFSKKSYEQYKFHDFPLGWYSDDRAWFEFSEEKPIFSINESKVFVRYSKLSISGRSDNFEQKNIAKIRFYKYIIFQKWKLFKKDDRLSLLRTLEKSIVENHPLKLYEKLWLGKYYLKNLDLYSFKKFIKRIYK